MAVVLLSEGKRQHRFRHAQELRGPAGPAGEEWLLCQKFLFAIRLGKLRDPF